MVERIKVREDSWRGQYEHAFPLLQKYGFSATFFIWTDAVGKPGFLTWEEIRELKNAGMEIGGHSKSHLHLAKIMEEAVLVEEIIEDKNFLERNSGAQITAFSYPYGEYNDMLIEIVKKAGYRAARGTDYGKTHMKNELFHLKSFVVTEDFPALLRFLGR